MKRNISKRRKVFTLLTKLLIIGFSGFLLSKPIWDGGAFVTSSDVDNSQGFSIIPKPVELSRAQGSFTLTVNSKIYVQGKSSNETDEIYNVGQYLKDKLSPSTDFSLDVIKSDNPPEGSIYLTTVGGEEGLGSEGYHLDVTKDCVVLKAYTPEGLFRGIQTIRQMLPQDIEKSIVSAGKQWTMPCSSITDYPAYSWRGMMLDVARHFISVEDVKRTIDLIAGYKMNKFHMHLSDDQGWRIEIKSRPKLTEIGSSTEVDGGNGGYYTQEQYKEIVNYAMERYITVIPEIDMPGHCSAALASYGELNPDGQNAKLYTGIEVGFSTLLCRSEVTYKFIDDVIGELAAMTPGEYIHIGGDEAKSTTKEDYDYFINKVDKIVSSHGRKSIGWNPFDTALQGPTDAMLQVWNEGSDSAQSKGMKIILSPSDKAYIDMKYNDKTPIGLVWAGLVPTDKAYGWDPADYAPQKSIAGIECTLWSETIKNMGDIEYLTFPRLPGYAEIGWTPKNLRDWNEYKYRLKSHAIRMENQGINFYKDPAVPW